LGKIKKEKNKIEEKPKKKSKLKKFIFIIFIIGIFCFAIKTAISINTWQNLALDMTVNRPSQVLDYDGEIIAEIGDHRNRENVSFDKIPENLKNAYVSIEDERFYKHFGVDIKRTVAAIGNYVLRGGKASFGGSTITQQLVKNITGDDSNSPTRKVKEWAKATQLEWCMDKDKILESYLNIIYVGPNVYGVQMGAKYYFDQDVTDLSLAQCAFLAGINNAPNAYNPFNEEKDNSEKIEKRTKTVLNKMLELGYISEDEYNQAVEEVEDGIEFEKGNIEPEGDGVYSYHTDALLSEVIADLAQRKGISKTFATNYLYMSDAKIYSTQKSNIQDEVEKEFEKKQYILKSNNNDETSQAAMIIIDHKTGFVLGCAGGLGEKTEARGFNRATQAIRQTGSSSKPLAVLIPALQEKVITPLSTYDDSLTTFIDYNNEEYSPINYNDYLGEITVRRAVESSQNIPFVKIMEELTPGVAIKYLKKMGISTLNEKDENLALSLGGLDKGISPLEMAGAYSALANNGIYIEPTFYKKIVSRSGEDFLHSKQIKRRAFSESVAYVTKELLTEPVNGNNGTATYCRIPGMDVAAKTGTTNEDYDRWLCGFTNYYTAVTWFGYDLSEPIRYNGKNPAGIIWSNVMNRIHKKLENSEFKEMNGVVSQKICKKSLKLANSGCEDVYTEYFIKGTVPGICTTHIGTKLTDIVDEKSTPKIKDVVKDTVEEVKNSISTEPEEVEQENIEEENNTVENVSEVQNIMQNTVNGIENNVVETNTTETEVTNNIESSNKVEIENEV